MCLPWHFESVYLLDYKLKKVGSTLFPIPGGAQGKVGWGCEQSGLLGASLPVAGGLGGL